jgi:hypothetical protein
MFKFARIVAAFLVLSFAGAAGAAPVQQKVVYHVNDSANAMAQLTDNFRMSFPSLL